MAKKSEPHIEYEEDFPQHPAPSRRLGKRRWPKILLGIVTGLVVLVIAAAGIVYYNLVKLSVNPLDFSALQSDSNGRTNILILGIGDPGHAGEKLSDSIMVLSIQNRSHQVAMISVPRDLRVNISGHGYAKINTANADGGPQLAEQAVANTLDIPINYYVETDFTGFKQAVDAVGGLDYTVTTELYDPEYPCAGNESQSCGLDIKPGNYHLDGTMALEIARCRKGTCGLDFGRSARQQQLLQKLQQKIATPAVYLNLPRLNALSAAVNQNIKTDLSVNNMIQVGLDLHNAKRTSNLVLSTAPGGYLTGAPGSSDLVPIGGNFQAIDARVQDIFQ